MDKWTAFKRGMGDTSIVSSRSRLIATVAFRDAEDGAEFQANARLIASAPALLDLVKSACSLWGFMRYDMSLSRMECNAAKRNYNKASALIVRIEEGG